MKYRSTYHHIDRPWLLDAMPLSCVGAFLDHCVRTMPFDPPSGLIQVDINKVQEIRISPDGMEISAPSSLGETLVRASIWATLVRAGEATPAVVSTDLVKNYIILIQRAFRQQGLKGRLLEFLWFKDHYIVSK